MFFIGPVDLLGAFVSDNNNYVWLLFFPLCFIVGCLYSFPFVNPSFHCSFHLLFRVTIISLCRHYFVILLLFGSSNKIQWKSPWHNVCLLKYSISQGDGSCYLPSSWEISHESYLSVKCLKFCDSRYSVSVCVFLFLQLYLVEFVLVVRVGIILLFYYCLVQVIKYNESHPGIMFVC